MILDVHAELLSMSLQHTVAEEIEALIPSVPHRGFRLVERQPELRHHRFRPRQSLLRAAAAEDDEVVGVRDDVSPERFAASAETPMLQEAVHVDVGEQGARDPALRRAALAGLAAAHAPRPVAVPPLDRSLQPHLDQMQHMPVDDAPGHRFEEVRMRDRVEIFRQIGVYHVGVAPADQPVRFLDRIDRAATRAIAIGVVLEVRLEDRLQHDLDGSLNHPIPNRRDAEGTFAAPRLRDRRPPHRIGPIVFETRSSRKPASHASTPDASICPVHPRRARIGAGQRVGVPKDVIAADLVVEDVEAESGLRLRLTIELSLKVPDLFGRFEAHRQSPPPRRLRKRIRSQGPFLRRNYPASQVVRPCPTPARSAAKHTASKPRPPTARVSPDYPHHPSTVPCPLPRWIERVHLSIASPSTRPSPLFRRVGIHIFTFEACSGFTHVTARWIAQPPKRRPLSRGSDPASHPTRPLVSYQINRQLSGWNLPPLVKRAFGTHGTNIEHKSHSRKKNVGFFGEGAQAWDGLADAADGRVDALAESAGTMLLPMKAPVTTLRNGRRRDPSP